MTTPKIFVSHSHLDSEFGLKLVADLRHRLGVDAVWYDESGGLHGGDEWWRTIVAEITARDTFIVILSPAALASVWVPREMGIAYLQHVKLGKRLRPILLHDTDLIALGAGDWALIQSTNFIGYPGDYEAALARLLADLDLPVAAPAAAPPAAAPVVDSRPPVIVRLVRDVNTAFGQEDWQVVVDKTDVLRQIAPDEMTAALWGLRGLALLEVGQGAPALQALTTALRATPHDVPLLRAKAQAERLTSQGDPVATLTLAYGLTPFEDHQLRLSLLVDLYTALLAAGRATEAAQRAAEALRLAPGDADWARRAQAAKLAPYVASYDAALKASKYAEALATCDSALQIAPGDADWARRALAAKLAPYVASYDAALKASKYAEALAACDSALQIAPGDADWRLRRETATAAAEQARVDTILPRRLATFAPPLQAPFVLRRFGATEVILPPMVDIPAGPFWMGSERSRDPQTQSDEPWHEVTLGAYQIGKYPLTVAEYARALAVPGGKVPKPSDWDRQLQHPDHPVVSVSWQDAQAYLAWLGDTTGDNGWRLPTEAEWEKAARWDAPTKTAWIYPWGDTWDKTKANTSDGGPGTTTPVGTYAERGDASPYGCHDMAGNVWEWTSSIYSGSNRVIRGGSWNLDPTRARAAFRYRSTIDNRDDLLGFRPARVASPGSR